jgi:hypothetical protein
MTCITFQHRNHHTTRHHRRGTSALESACQNRHGVPLHTASAEGSRTHSVGVELAKLGSDGYRPLRSAAAQPG